MMTGIRLPADAGWKLLESPGASPTRGEFRVFDTGVATANGRVLLAVDGSGLRHLLAPVDETFSQAHDRRSGGVHLVTRSLVDDAGQRQYIDLACQKQHLNTAFGHMAEEVLAELRVSADQPFQTCRRTLQRWRELMDREVSDVLTTEALCGLFGELWNLRAIVVANPAGLNAWQGPRGARHDFCSSGVSLEVKATLSRSQWRYRVHGLTQLDAPRGAVLFLCAMRLELNGPVGTTVPALIEQIFDSGVDRREFIEKLSSAGYQLRDEVHYHQFRFNVLDVRAYNVVPGFPRLTEADFGTSGVPRGVEDIDYTVDLAACTSAPLSSSDLEQLHVTLSNDTDASAANAAI